MEHERMIKADLSDNKNKSENSLTIVLALKDRVQFTFRWLRYANSVQFPFKILIADGGLDKSVAAALDNQENYPNINYEYVRYPYDETYKHYYTKLLDAVSRVRTPYVAMADNDDFFMIGGLKQSVEFLTNHPDFSSCRGVISAVRVRPNEKFQDYSCIYGDKRDIAFAKHRYPTGSTLENTASERVKSYFTCYRPNWYDVFRKEQAVVNYKALLEANPQDLILAQNIPMSLGYVAGKAQRESFLYLVRQYDVPDSSDCTETMEKGDHFDRMLLETWSEDFKNFANSIADSIAQKDGISYSKAYQIVKEGYREFMAPFMVECLSVKKPVSPIVLAKRWMLDKMGPVGDFFRKQYQFIRRGINGETKLLQFEPGHRMAKSDKDFKMLFNFLTSSPESVNQ